MICCCFLPNGVFTGICHFSCLNSISLYIFYICYLPNAPLLLSFLYRWGNWGPGRLRKLTFCRKLGSGIVGVKLTSALMACVLGQWARLPGTATYTCAGHVLCKEIPSQSCQHPFKAHRPRSSEIDTFWQFATSRQKGFFLTHAEAPCTRVALGLPPCGVTSHIQNGAAVEAAWGRQVSVNWAWAPYNRGVTTSKNLPVRAKSTFSEWKKALFPLKFREGSHPQKPTTVATCALSQEPPEAFHSFV